MATPSQAQAVKSLNKSTGRRRFVFRNFSQRLEDIEINVYHSLEKVKSDPSEGSSFFRDCLIEWRELNTAEDFISFYEEMMPLTQSLPLVLLHKESIASELFLRLHIKARLSLEPILRLIAALSRDLLEDFLPLFPRLVDSLVYLLENGADREPEIIEQIFTSWSYIMMYMQKYLTRKPVDVLKFTVKLRYYPKVYVQEFMAQATSYLLRNAPDEQLKQGIARIMAEVVKKPFVGRESGVSALLYYVMTGSSLRFHSRAERVLQIMTNDTIYCIGNKAGQGAVLDVVRLVFQRLCEEIEPQELNLMWKCLYKKVGECVNSGDVLHLSRLLSILISTVQMHNGRRVFDYRPMLELVLLLVETYVMTSVTRVEKDDLSEVIDKMLQLMLCILDGLHSCDNISAISECSLRWAPIFKLRNSSLLPFIKELLQKETGVLYSFRVNVISSFSDFVENSEEVVINLLVSFCEKLQVNARHCDFTDETSAKAFSRICSYLEGAIRYWSGAVNDIANGDSSCELNDQKLALLWGAISCYAHMSSFQVNSSLLLDLINAVDQLLLVRAGYTADISQEIWESLMGAALSSYNKIHGGNKSGSEVVANFLFLAKKHKSSSHVLSAVADYLDSEFGPPTQETGCSVSHQGLVEKEAMDAVDLFADNLCHSDKDIRVSTLRILCHYEPLSGDVSLVHQPIGKKRKTEDSETFHVDIPCSNVLQLLLSIEMTPLSISTSRQIVLLISRIQMCISTGRISEVYVPLVLNAIVGILHNRFSYLWDPALECLSVLVSRYATHVWDKFVCCLKQCQSVFQMSHNLPDSGNAKLSEQPTDLVDRFKLFVNLASASASTPHATILMSLLQALQKIPTVVEPLSGQFIPLFLMFLGYSTDDLVSVGLFNSHACKGKEWKAVLKEWLNLLKLMKNPKSFFLSQFVKEVLQNRILDENDPEIQMKALDCLLSWKDDFLLPYAQNLKNLISSRNLREELTTWSLSKEANLIEESHRAYLVPLVIRLLIPKVRKLKTLASRKNASIHHRKAILNFVAELETSELPLFFALLIKPLQIVSKEADGAAANLFWSSPEDSLGEFEASNFLIYFTMVNITSLSWKKRYGFLHVVEDVLGVFDESHVRPFLDLLVGCVVRILGNCSLCLDIAKSNGFPSDIKYSDSKLDPLEEDSSHANQILTSTNLKQLKDLRSLCLKIISFILNKYEDHEFGPDFWDLFFTSVKPLIAGFKQESSSSEKPSSLFSSFIAMSRNYRLVSLLCREMSLVPDIFSILSVKSASDGAVSCAIKFVENLLSLDNELDDKDSHIKTMLHSNVKALVSSLQCLFGSDNARKRKLVKSPGESLRRIFKFLPKYIKEPLLAKDFTEIVLLFLEKGSQSSDVCIEAIQVIRDIIPVLGSGITTKILKSVSSLLISAELDMRLCICDLLDALAENDASVFLVAKLVRELNAISASEMGELDYDAVINCYGRINAELFSEVQVDHAVLILSHCVHHMSSEELILRESAHRSLLSFVDFSALLLCGEGNNQEKTNHIEGGCWTKPSIQRIVNKFLLKHMGDAMNRKEIVRKEWVDFLSQMVLKLPDVANLRSLMALCSHTDVEKDFFKNILHMQKHMRAKALSRFTNVLSLSKISEGITKKVFVPLFFHMLLEAQQGKDEHIKNACIEALASIAGHMDWKSYYALLSRCFRVINLTPDKQKVLLRLICSILDKFHFSEIFSSKELRESLGKFSDSGSTVTVTSDMLAKSDTSAMVTEIQTCLYKVLFPKIQKLLDSDSDKVNVNISLAALKLLKLLPGDVMDLHLSSIIHRISSFLKSHLESIRDEARSALASCLRELGFEYLQFIVKVLRATLKRGYELHVLGYTLNFVLSKCLLNLVCGKLDYCLEDLLSIVVNDILGDVAQEKEVEKIASKMKETRRKKSFETLEMIAGGITFKSHGLKLLGPVAVHLQKHLTPKVKTKLENMLHHIAVGIERNPSVAQTDLFTFIYGLVEDGIKVENGKHENISVTVPSKHSHLITQFSLRILHKRVKNLKLGKNDEHILSLLDPFVLLLADCLNSKYEDVLCSSIGCLTLLARLPLLSLESNADRIKATLLDIAQSSVDSGSPLVQSCLKLLTLLLQSTKITLSTDQLLFLIQCPLFLDLERNQSPVALSLLKGIVNRKLVVPEIYDLVTRVAELMVTSQSESIRKECSRIFLQFLLDYRISANRLQQHLDFLLSNLRYEHSTGREAVLEMLHVIIVKFPRSIVDEQSQTFFVNLVVCLANDTDNNVRSMTGAAIKTLMGCISPSSLHCILEYCLSWYLGGKQQLWGASAQVLGLLVEVMEKGFRKHINSILPKMLHILKSDSRQLELTDESNIPHWKEAYYSLVLLEKMLDQFRDLYCSRDLQDIWEAVCELLLHSHSWLRNRSSRLIALYFEYVTEGNGGKCANPSGNYFLISPSRLFLIAASLCCQLKTQTDDAAGNLITCLPKRKKDLMTHNLVSAICCLHSLLGQTECVDPSMFWSTLEKHEKDRFLEAFHILDSMKERSMFLSLTSCAYKQKDRDESDYVRHFLVSLLLKKMGKCSLQMEAIQMGIVFNSFRDFILQISQDDCLRYASHILLPLYKVCEGLAGQVISDKMKQLAQVTTEQLREKLGMENFIQVRGLIRKNLNEKRDKRKQQEKLMAVVNPMRNAKRKLRIAAKHRANKKRKLFSMKVGRWMH
ncbi:Small subunit processome component 20-like protein [Quillaja saponaria]|uniref:Small subunit processome component 20-like protein n=1 Tax=Quillaja saponaria TaxID=32244 RepID=A0AAD7PHS3_QUISA|nr:Small subunit processome component 20-like protein [Quillaja saponaria]